MQIEHHLSPDMPITEAGRAFLAAELVTIFNHQQVLQESADVVAVHETRKAIRRTLTAFNLFEPFYEPGSFDGYRRRLGKIMRRLGRARDAAVFLEKLQQFQPQSLAPVGMVEFVEPVSLAALECYALEAKLIADTGLRHAISKPRYRAFLALYMEFVQTPGVDTLPADLFEPVAVRHLAPLLIYQQVAAVRAYAAHLGGAGMKQLHKLRIQFKQLRYTLEFFAPLLGPEIDETLATVRQLQEHLGQLNDAGVALQFLTQAPDQDMAVYLYHTAKEAELSQLMDSFWPLWHAFDSFTWRRNLALALAAL